jgi:hypothetical protein
MTPTRWLQARLKLRRMLVSTSYPTPVVLAVIL